MTAILGIDLGKTMGWGLVGRHASPRFGTIQVVSQWSPLGPCLLVLEDRLHELIVQHQPDVLATATQFVTPRQASTDNLIPIFTGYGILLMLASAMRIRVEMIRENRARASFLGKGMTPKGSAAKKAAVIRSCQDRGWAVTTDHEADALCVATAAQERLDPARAYETTPLFRGPVTMRQRRSA